MIDCACLFGSFSQRLRQAGCKKSIGPVTRKLDTGSEKGRTRGTRDNIMQYSVLCPAPFDVFDCARQRNGSLATVRIRENSKSVLSTEQSYCPAGRYNGEKAGLDEVLFRLATLAARDMQRLKLHLNTVSRVRRWLTR